MPTLQNNSIQPQSVINGVVVILLFDFRPEHRSWAWLRLMQGTGGLFKTITGLQFAKVMGSGEGGGFGLRPSATHQGLIFVFDGLENAANYLKSKEYQAYTEKTREYWQGILGVNSCRGTWNNQAWQSSDLWPQDSNKEQNQEPDQEPNEEPFVASLTRGSIRAAKAVSFWRYAPAAQIDLNSAPGCELAMGLGEAPVLRQCTFSLWRNTQSLMDYAHQGAHQKAIAAAKKHSFFTESMFVRMNVLHMFGQWMGKSFGYNSSALTSYQLSI